MIRMRQANGAPRPARAVAACLAMLVGVGTVDYLAGFEMVFSVFYLLPVALAAWQVGQGFALAVAVLSALIWVGGDLASGAHYSSSFIVLWNALILTVFYSIIVWILVKLRSLQTDLEQRVALRTEALTREWPSGNGCRQRSSGPASGNNAGSATTFTIVSVSTSQPPPWRGRSWPSASRLARCPRPRTRAGSLN